ncbi:FtsX-like permease family protein [Gulosibacter sp. 10]|uniref:FtsX-like permease family protein n=1 Tax=Gulosibacter sp. 10 TaxID=1255570 RepID=UPI00097ED9B0|nr:ABC transporter permease [Gulosibacter sp. 10]SJM61664.1 ABC lipoprotein transporter, permease component [Gulosibacter sp. 10]
MSAALGLAGTQIRRSPRKVLAVLLAALLSAMAIMATGTFIRTMNAQLETELAAPVTNADAVVRVPGGDLAPVLEQLEAVPEVAAADPHALGFAEARVDGVEKSVQVYGIPDAESLRWMTLASGEWPGADEAVASQATLDRLGLAVGDEFPLTGLYDPESATTAVISGVVELPDGAEGSTGYLYADQATAAGFASSDEILVQAADGVAEDALVAALEADGLEAVTSSQYIAEMIDTLAGGSDVLATVFMIFVAIALLAASMVIRNTFQVLLAQRLRENGLLRLIGATGTQIQRVVLAEALLLGLLGGVLGVAVGFGLGWGIAAIAGSAGAGVSFGAGWAIAALGVTVAVTVLAAWAPARSASRLAPMAALRASSTTDRESKGRRLGSWITGAVITAIGAAAVFVSGFFQNMLLLIPSGLVLALGLIILVPLLVTVLMPLIARMTSGGGTVAKLAGENLVRTSRRTGTVVLAIALGGSLVIAMLTALQSASASLQASLASQAPVDTVVATRDDAALPEAVIDEVEALEVVDSSGVASSSLIETSSTQVFVDSVIAAPADWLAANDLEIAPGELLVPGWAVEGEEVDGTTAEFAVPGGEAVPLTVRVSPIADTVQPQSAMSYEAVVSPETAAQLGGTFTPDQIWLSAADGKASELMTALDDLESEFAEIESYGSLQTIQLYEQVFQVVAAFVLAMLALTVIISAIGLASVVALAVAERGREIALLRALGLTRGRTRLMVVVESVSLALVGAAFSLVIGIPLGIAATFAAFPEQYVAISLPWPGIAMVIGVALGLGILAGVGPAGRAARIAPAQGLAAE